MRPAAVIFDIDGTLADVSHLSEYVTGINTDYDTFHTLVCDADPIEWVVEEVHRRINTGYEIILVTARQEKFQQQTEQWLLEHEIDYTEMWMRRTNDVRSDYAIKSEILSALKLRYDITHAYDDNPHTTQLWLGNGIPTTVVPGYPALMKETWW